MGVAQRQRDPGGVGFLESEGRDHAEGRHPTGGGCRGDAGRVRRGRHCRQRLGGGPAGAVHRTGRVPGTGSSGWVLWDAASLYQQRGYSWLAFSRRWRLGACLADDMGLGKTVQTLAAIQQDRQEGVEEPTLLVFLTSVLNNWRNEAARFTPDLPLMVHHGPGRQRDTEFVEMARQHAIVVASQGELARDVRFVADVPWRGIVLVSSTDSTLRLSGLTA